MCKCTPNIRTPFCGKVNCTWPENTASTTMKGQPIKLDVKTQKITVTIEIASSDFDFKFNGILPTRELTIDRLEKAIEFLSIM